LKVPAASALDLGSGGGLTVEGWINPTNASLEQDLVEWNNGSGFIGVHLALSVPYLTGGPGSLWANLVDTAGNAHQISTVTNVVSSGTFQHVALSYNKASGNTTLYLDGNIVAQTNLGSFTPYTSSDLYVGWRPSGPFTGLFYGGAIDELALYNRELSPIEIKSIYNAGSSSICTVPPSIIVSPANLEVNPGASALFQVAASGDLPLTYQWLFNGVIIPGGTNSVLSITSVQASNAGAYSVMVSNSAGTAVSSTASLSVNSAVACVPPSAGLVGWWRGEGNELDSAGTNNGSIVNGVGFVPGEAGQAFNFSALASGVNLGNPANLHLQNFTLEAWIKRSSATSCSYDVYTIAHVLGGAWGAYGIGLNDKGNIFLTKIGYSNVYSTNSVTDTNAFHHIVATKSGSTVTFYIDGVAETAAPYDPGFVFNGTFAIGARGSDYNSTFRGAIDEASIYNRPLSAPEVQALYQGGSAGKCIGTTSPVIFAQPAPQTVPIGGTASFAVAVGGTAPLSFQWFKNGSSISGATDSLLVVTNSQLADIGSYSVLVTNVAGSVTSDSAKLSIGASCAALPSGLVAWWPAEGNAFDAVGSNNAVYTNDVSFAPGLKGLAFNFDGATTAITVPPSPSLSLSNLTIETWIFPTDSGTPRPIFEYANSTGGYALGFWYNIGAGAQPSPGAVFGFARDAVNPNNNFYLASTGGLLPTNEWSHIAFAFDSSGMRAVLYVNGVVVATNNFGIPVHPDTQFAVNLGYRPVGSSDLYAGFRLKGELDEVSLYNRVLSPAEIGTVYAAGSAGKCSLPQSPSIAMQPTSQTTSIGRSVSFSVLATGTAPLAYQWLFNGNNLQGATNSTFALGNVQTSDAGTYSVIVSNSAGQVISSGATLTVNSLACAAAPPGLISWWKGDGNALDSVGGNNGTLYNGTNYASGEVQQAFSFNGLNQWVEIPDSPSLNPSNALTLETWVYVRGNPNTDLATIVTKFSTTIGELNQYQLETHYANGLLNFRPLVYLADGYAYLDGKTIIQFNTWYHVAMTYDGSTLKLYVNGAFDGSVPGAGPIPAKAVPLRIGGPSAGPWWFNGRVDEVSLYNRALSSSEVLAIYNAGAAGKCFAPVAPMIITQPAGQSTILGGSAIFSVTASGSAPLSYQWFLGTTALAGATNATLALANVVPANAGTYSVVVSNSAGTVTSSNAVLVINVPCITPAQGLVHWWKGESNVNDLVSGNNGVLRSGAGFASGQVGSAFVFNGVDQYVEIPDAPSLNPSTNLTFEAWVYVSGYPSTDVATIMTKQDLSVVQYQLETHIVSGKLTFRPTLIVPAGWADLDGNTAVQLNTWYHVAMTYDGSALKLYVNGALDGSAPASGAIVTTGTTLKFGGAGGGPWNFNGRLDEASFYDRALSGSEIQAIYAAGTAGKCFTPTAPSIVSQPANQNATLGGTASFSVSAIGTQPLSYQWQFGTTPLLGATSSTLTLTNIQFVNAGAYSVIVSNSAGTLLSTTATLSVNSTCATPPAGLVSWWSGNGDATDLTGGQNGIFTNPEFASGEVGQSFKFDGSGNNIRVPAAPSLDLGKAAGLTVEAWVNPVDAAKANPIVEWLPASAGGYGVHFYAGGLGQLYANVYGGGDHVIQTSTGVLTNGGFQHVALTYDKASGTARLFLNGAMVVQTAFATFIPETSQDLYIGYRPNFVPFGPYAFNGLIDEVTLYSRALTAPEIQAIFTAGSAGKCTTSVAPSFLVQPQNQTVTAGSAANLSAVVAGSLPMSLQWWFNGNQLTGQTNGVLSLNDVSKADAGPYSLVAMNSAGSATSSVAVLTVTPAPTLVQIGNASLAGGGTVTLPLNLVANGNENAASLSVDFDPTLLTYQGVALSTGGSNASLVINSSQVASGQLGVAIAMPAGITFGEGTHQVAVVTFGSPAVKSATSAAVTFGDAPVSRLVVDVFGTVLPATFASGSVSLPVTALEGDVYPRPGGDESLTISDWVQVGRYVAALDTPTNALEFQRADCAPRDTLGDGALTVSDWVQAGRYAAGLDPAVRVGGPTSPVPNIVIGPAILPIRPKGQSNPRQLSLIAPLASEGTVSVALQAQGDENALAFSLAFDPAKLAFTGAVLAGSVNGATLNVNPNKIAQGQLGIALALPPGQTFAVGAEQLINVSFRSVTPASGTAGISFSDQPVVRGVADSNASVLTADYINGTVTPIPLPSLKITQAPTSVTLSWPTGSTGFVLQESADGSTAGWTTVQTTPVVSNNENLVSVPLTSSKHFYRLYHP
jgi:hypothetical protein